MLCPRMLSSLIIPQITDFFGPLHPAYSSFSNLQLCHFSSNAMVELILILTYVQCTDSFYRKEEKENMLETKHALVLL